MKISLITTVFNESKNINAFLNSALNQILLPDEFVIVDGGSTDDTFKKIIDFSQKNKKLNIKIIKKKGNRSIGRNEAIKNTSNEIIAITDSGNILDKYWLNNLVDPFKDKSVDVVAGYYKGLAKNIFQKCLIPFVLVMPDKANGAKEFLPATRSMAIKKSVWKRVGGFDEKLWHNEDYAFANKLKENKAKIVLLKMQL